MAAISAISLTRPKLTQSARCAKSLKSAMFESFAILRTIASLTGCAECNATMDIVDVSMKSAATVTDAAMIHVT